MKVLQTPVPVRGQGIYAGRTVISMKQSTLLPGTNLWLLIVFPSWKTIMMIIILFEHYCKPCQRHECLAGKLKPSWVWLCVQVDCLYSAHISWTVYGENCPPSLIWRAWLAYLNQIWFHNSSVPWIAVARTCGSFIGSHSSTPVIQHLPSFNYPWERVSMLLF